eukprot:8847872-Pyramimonas_sp.AAC.1
MAAAERGGGTAPADGGAAANGGTRPRRARPEGGRGSPARFASECTLCKHCWYSGHGRGSPSAST